VDYQLWYLAHEAILSNIPEATKNMIVVFVKSAIATALYADSHQRGELKDG
jgi:hypothetical protein